MSCDLSCVINFVLTVSTVVSFPLYVSVLIVLIVRRKQLESSFFALCISVGVADLSFLLSRFLSRRVAGLIWNAFPTTRPVIESIVYQTASNMIAGWGLYFTQVAGAVMLGINRMVEIYQKDWTSRMTTYAVVFQWLWTFPFALPCFHPCCHSRMASNISFRPVFIDRQVLKLYWDLATLLEAGFVMPLLIAVHIAVIRKIIKHRQQVSANVGTGSQISSAEKRFTAIGTVLCGSYIFVQICFLVAWANDGNYLNGLHGLVTAVGQTVFTSANPYLLLGFSTVFRQQYLSFWSGKPANAQPKSSGRCTNSRRTTKVAPFDQGKA